jgi:hypothetical protein
MLPSEKVGNSCFVLFIAVAGRVLFPSYCHEFANPRGACHGHLTLTEVLPFIDLLLTASSSKVVFVTGTDLKTKVPCLESTTTPCQLNIPFMRIHQDLLYRKCQWFLQLFAIVGLTLLHTPLPVIWDNVLPFHSMEILAVSDAAAPPWHRSHTARILGGGGRGLVRE